MSAFDETTKDIVKPTKLAECHWQVKKQRLGIRRSSDSKSAKCTDYVGAFNEV
ncbi:hypothetical protein GJ744_011043 [Endocarpon pusillum]|uniref:Uncharacterized protein n=1 Tax=Endocarpon pusillum TaxID=364733 RepID=A0A8H7AGI2_9EURO|nr:hypothetical protein GJ744_011043 [Endocarpon pusillum]